MSGPLEGVRVLDFTTMVAGPVATMMLADQGAEVIKIEPPRGDLMRHLGRNRNGISAFFLCCNRNKRSLTADLKTAVGLEIVRKLMATADVLIHNFRPGTAERIGLGEDAVRGLRRDIVYVSITGFGESGPYAGQRAYDPVIQALSGLADVQRDQDTGRPRMVRTIIADNTTALTAAQAITAALFARERSGQGQHVRVAMLDAMISYLWPDAMTSLTLVGDEIDPADGEIGPDLIFAGQDLIDDPRFKTARERSMHAVERREIVAAELEKWTANEILPRLLNNDVPSAPVLSRLELLHDLQVRENRLLEEFQSKTFGKVRMPRPAALFDRTPAGIRTLAPPLGADNAAILRELGYSGHDIARLEHARPVRDRLGN